MLGKPGAEAEGVKQVTTGELFRGVHCFTTDGTVVIELLDLLGRGVRVFGPHVNERVSELFVLQHLLVRRGGGGPDVQDQDCVNQRKRKSMQKL